MRRKPPTGKLAASEREQSPSRSPVRLIVEYADVDDFLTDYTDTLVLGRGQIATERALEPGTLVQLGLTFPGLVEPLIVDAMVRSLGESPDGGDPCVDVELVESSTNRLATLVPRIRDRDRRVVLPVLNVLIVEDNRHIAEMVKNGLAASARRELRDFMFTFEIAEHGAAALRLLEHQRIDVAIVEVYLPVLDGASLIRQMRTTLGLASLPIITMSAGRDAARTAALRAGASVFLDKPVQLRHLIEAMRKLIRS